MRYSTIALSALLLLSSNNNQDGNNNAVNAFTPAHKTFGFSSFHTTTSKAATSRSNNIRTFDVSVKDALNSEVNGDVNGADESPFKVETDTDQPYGPIHTLTINHLPGDDDNSEPIVIQTGKIGRQAAGAVTLTRGDTVLYATAARDDNPKAEIDFLPLSVEHQERFSSAGMTSGSYNKRDGRPAEHEILTCRLIDRPLRPLIANGWRHETQLLSWVISYDGLRSCDPLAITASAAALYLSDVPLKKPVAASMIGYIDDQFVLNPTNEQMEKSRLHLTIAGTKDAVLMIEGAADFLPEDVMIQAVQFGHAAIKVICEGIEQLADAKGVTKNYDTIKPPVEGLQERVNELMTERIDDMFNVPAYGDSCKSVESEKMSKLSKAVVEELEEEFPEETIAIKASFKELLCSRLFHRANTLGLRGDGRSVSQIRSLNMEAGFLPRVHGSALFTRGETQNIATSTLGDSGMRQKIDKIDGQEEKRFYLQYSFPPSCVGETGRVGTPGRREVGHGNLAERALIPTLPSEEEFPYTIRVESLITESHGSSSMASVCGGCLSLMDAGVPIKHPIAGIAMGMLLGDKDGVSDENAIILSDITGAEDALGTMDFKVAGNREGITTFQLDIKCEGLTLETMERALAQAKEGRLHILDAMDQVLPEPRSELPPTVPKIASFSIPVDSIGKVIGPGGKQIRAIIEDFELENMNVDEEGNIQVSGFNATQLKEAEAFVGKLLNGGRGGGGGGRGGDGPKEERPKYAGPPAVEGEIYTGKIMGIHPFGVFCEILPGAEDGSTPGLEGLCHVSELARDRVRNCEGFMRSMNVEEIEVMYLGINEKGQIRLSRKAVLEGKGGGGKKKNSPPPPPPASMSEEEIDVIARAIESATDA